MKSWLYLDHPALKFYPATPHILIHRPLRFIPITRHSPFHPLSLGILNNPRFKQILKILSTHALAFPQGRPQSLTELRIIYTRLQIMWRDIRIYVVKYTLRHCAYIKKILIKIGISHSVDFFHTLFHLCHNNIDTLTTGVLDGLSYGEYFSSMLKASAQSDAQRSPKILNTRIRRKHNIFHRITTRPPPRLQFLMTSRRYMDNTLNIFNITANHLLK
ncbi:hypothetical protein ACEQUB_p00012 (plasmid) [Ralstonia syzygii]